MTIEISGVNTREEVAACYRRWYDIAGVIVDDDISCITKDQVLMIERLNIMLNSKAGEPRISMCILSGGKDKHVERIEMSVIRQKP